MLKWLSEHPAFCTLILWPLLTGLFTAIARKRTPEEYAAMPPRFAAFLRLIAAIGWNVPKTLETAKSLVDGKPPEQQTRSVRPPPLPPMSVLMLLVLVVSCSPAANRTAQKEAQADIEITSYTAEVAKCRTDARAGFDACVASGVTKLDCKEKNLHAFDVCACGVDAKYKHDAGVCQ